MPPLPPSELCLVHDDLEELLMLHQEALVRLDVGEARAYLDRYAVALRAHVLEEEQVVLPEFVALDPGLRDELEHFQEEHEGILRWLERMDLLLEELEDAGAPTPRDVIALLDREAAFKRLMEHHAGRERALLYPTLDRELGPRGWARLWSGVESCRAAGLLVS